MNLSRREITMAVVTLLLVLVGGTWLLGRPLVKRWTDAAVQRQRLADENRLSARLIRQRDDVGSRLAAIQSRLPRFKPGQPVTAELLKTLKRLADEFQVAITRVEPDQEKQVGDLSEIAINCQWDSTLEGMVRFLHAVQAQGAVLDIRQITMAPAQSAAGRLKGSFTVFCAFSRTEEDAPAAAPAAAPAVTTTIGTAAPAAPVEKAAEPAGKPASAPAPAAAAAANPAPAEKAPEAPAQPPMPEEKE